MSFRMGVQEDKILPPGPYEAVLDKVEKKQTAHGERLMWTWSVPSENAQVIGFSSLNEKTSAKPYRWASAHAGENSIRDGWTPASVEGKWCIIHVDTAQDAQGRVKNKVQDVMPLGKGFGEQNANGSQGQKQDDHNNNEEHEFADIPS